MVGSGKFGPRVFREGVRVQVVTDASIRIGEIGTVTEVRSATVAIGGYGIVAVMPDGQERCWKPEELECLAG
jgi:hypothetical protein